jgi:hypothetical protein
MFLNLLVSKLEYLHAIWKSSLGGLGFGEEVNHFLILVGLFNVTICKVNDCVTVWEGFSSNFVTKHNFFLVILKDSLDFAIISFDLIFNSRIF